MLFVYTQGTIMDVGAISVTTAFYDYGYWIKYKNPTEVELWITEDFLGNGGMITGIGQSSGNIEKVIIMAGKLDYFFIQTKRNGETFKFKLKKKNLLSPIEDSVLQMTPMISGMKTVAKWWSKLPSEVADSRKAVVAAATTMMATDKANYAAALRHINNKRKLEEKNKGSASTSQAVRDMTTPTPPPEDPLTTPFAKCFALVPHHPSFGPARPRKTTSYTPSMLSC